MTQPLRFTRAHAALGLAALCAVVLALVSPASAQSRKLGPDVGTLVQVVDGTLVFDALAGNANFTEDARFSATRGDVEWTPFDAPARVVNGGTRAILEGTIGGVAIDDYFAGGEARRILVRNGDGSSTELDVMRTEAFLFVTHRNRAPSEPVTSTLAAASRTVDAAAGATVSLELEPVETGERGTDVVVAVTFDADSDVAGRSPQLRATDTASSAEYYSPSYFAGFGDVGFYHFTLPDGTYRISATDSVGSGNASASSRTSSYVDLGVVGTVDVSSASRLFSIPLPTPTGPELVDATLTIEGVAGLEPTISDRVLFNVTVGSRTTPSSVAYAQRDVGDPGPVRIPVRLPAGSYDVNVSVFRAVDQANGTGFSASYNLGAVDLAPETSVSLPEISRVAGTILDPGFTLANGSGGPGASAYHIVTASGEHFNANVILGGFARTFTLYAPRGVALKAGASLTATLGKPRPRYSPSKNETASIVISPDAYPLTCGDGACDLDITAPSLPKFVVVTGKVVDASGRPAIGASVSASLDGLDGDPTVSIATGVITKPDGTFSLRLPRAAGYRITATRQ